MYCNCTANGYFRALPNESTEIRYYFALHVFMIIFIFHILKLTYRMLNVINIKFSLLF